jgi:hypothetical protein
MPQWGTSRAAPGGVIGQVVALITRPKAFFQKMPQTQLWVGMAILILCLVGFGASNQTVQTQSSAAASSTQTGFSVNMLQSGAAAPAAQATAVGNAQTPSTTSVATAPTTAQTASTETSSRLLSVLLAIFGAVALWVGQALLLCLVTMFRGYAPDLGRSLQIAVWASLPLALMLILRQINFAAGGTGGALGLSLLLTQWKGYSELGELAQRILAAFMSNISLFWLWDLALLYLGARYALGGNRLSVLLVIGMWIVTSAIAPALVGSPVTTIARQTSASTATTQKTTSSTANQAQMNLLSGGGVPPSGGMPPSGGPGGN